MNWLERFCFGNRRRRVVICAFLRPRRGCGVGLPGAQSLLSAAGKCKPFRRSAFLANYPRLLSFSLAGVLFHTSSANEKTRTIVRVFSFGNRRRHTLPGTCPRHTSRDGRATRCIPFASGKSFRSRAPRFNKTIRTLADFPSADICLAVHGNIFSSDTKQKAHTNV